ncbi:MAG: T9SS type A sorting domain-containing protein [candidate division FCPU426 bacterium]
MHKQGMKKMIWLACAAWLALPAATWAAYSWVIEGGGTLNSDNTRDGAFGSLASDGTQMYTAYIENIAQPTPPSRFWVYVKFYNGSGWQMVGNTTCSYTTGRSCKYPDIIAAGTNNLWVAFPQFDAGGNTYTTQLAISHWNGSDWNQKWSLRHDDGYWCEFPSVAQYNGTPYVVWQENTRGNGYDFNGHIYAARLNGSTWDFLGGNLDTYSGGEYATTPDVCVDPATGVPYATYIDSNNVYVKKWNGNDWEQVGGQVNVGHYYAYNPTIDHDGTHLVVTYSHWYSGYMVRIYVHRWNGSSWEQIGNALNNDTSHDAWYPIVKLYGGAMYVAFEESFYYPNAFNYLKTFNGTSWETLAGALSYDVSQNVFEPDMAFHNGVPYVTWYEPLAGPGTNLAYTARLDNVIPTSTVTSTFTITPTVTVTPTLTETEIVTATPTSTISPTDTPVPPGSTETDTPTSTETVTRTFTTTPTRTISPTRTPTPTHTPVLSPTITPTPTATQTISRTVTPTITLTPYPILDQEIVAYPNPAKDRVVFAYRLDAASDVTIRIYDLNGSEVARINNPGQAVSAGAQSVWTLEKAASGIYLVRVVIEPLNGSAKREKTLKIAVVK